MRTKKQSRFWYWATRVASWFYAKIVFKRKIIRNEIKGKKGPFVIIANHQASLDFVNLIGASRRKMTFVVSDSFYNTLPVKGVMTKIGVIPKQQFQTTVTDIKRMKNAIDNGRILVVYPAGLMCEDGVSTPIPDATYKFLKWIGTDIYMAKTCGTYFVSPKWSKIKRSGKTTLDIYKLFDKEELNEMDEAQIKERAEGALLFDAYREQEELKIKYKGASNIEGLENVLYMCPECKSEFKMQAKDNKIWCTECGFAHESDELGFLHNVGSTEKEIRYVSDWSALIFEDVKRRLSMHPERELSSEATIQMIDYEKRKFVDIARGQVTIDKENIVIRPIDEGPSEGISISIASFASLPFKPGKYFEAQKGPDIYRLVLADGRHAVKFVNTVEAFYELHSKIAKRSVR